MGPAWQPRTAARASTRCDNFGALLRLHCLVVPAAHTHFCAKPSAHFTAAYLSTATYKSCRRQHTVPAAQGVLGPSGEQPLSGKTCPSLLAAAGTHACIHNVRIQHTCMHSLLLLLQAHLKLVAVQAVTLLVAVARQDLLDFLACGLLDADACTVTQDTGTALKGVWLCSPVQFHCCPTASAAVVAGWLRIVLACWVRLQVTVKGARHRQCWEAQAVTAAVACCLPKSSTARPTSCNGAQPTQMACQHTGTGCEAWGAALLA